MLFGQRLCLGDAGHLCRDFQLLIVLCIGIIILRPGRRLDASACRRVDITDAARRILCIRRADVHLVFCIAPVLSLPDDKDGRFRFISRLIKQNKDTVGRFKGDSRVMAEGGQKSDVACFYLFQPRIKRIAHRCRCCAQSLWRCRIMNRLPMHGIFSFA